MTNEKMINMQAIAFVGYAISSVSVAALTSPFPNSYSVMMGSSQTSFNIQHQYLGLTASNISDLITRTFDRFDRCDDKSQIFIAIAGAPGSGKSTLAKRFVDSINRIKNNSAFSVLVPMDGYHHTQEQLQKMGESGTLIGDLDATSGEFTTFEDLMRRRGAPWTFDSEALFQNLASTKEKGYGSFPIYDRRISDPVMDQIQVTVHHRVIVCEGNYILAFDDPSWKPLQSIWDDTWLIDVPEVTLKERLVRRHLQNWTPAKEERFGIGRAGAMAKVESSDLKHAQFVYRTSRNHANVLITNA